MLNGVHVQWNKSLKRGVFLLNTDEKPGKAQKTNSNPTTKGQALKYWKRLQCGILTGPVIPLKNRLHQICHLKLFLRVLLGMFPESQHSSFPSRSDIPCIMFAICLSHAPYFTLLHYWWKCKLIQPLWRTVWRFLKKLKTVLHMTLQFHSWASIWKKIWSERIHAPQCSLQRYLY